MSGAGVVTFACTGNAARSVMAACLLRDRLGDDAALEVHSAGTLVLPNLPMSLRTRTALHRHGLSDPWHRSRQLGPVDAERSSLILVMEAAHVAWVRRELPEAVPITGTLRGVVRELPNITGADLNARVAELRLADKKVQPCEEVRDPAGGEQPSFDACIDELAELIDELAIALRPR